MIWLAWQMERPGNGHRSTMFARLQCQDLKGLESHWGVLSSPKAWLSTPVCHDPVHRCTALGRQHGHPTARFSSVGTRAARPAQVDAKLASRLAACALCFRRLGAPIAGAPGCGATRIWKDTLYMAPMGREAAMRGGLPHVFAQIRSRHMSCLSCYKCAPTSSKRRPWA